MVRLHPSVLPLAAGAPGLFDRHRHLVDKLADHRRGSLAVQTGVRTQDQAMRSTGTVRCLMSSGITKARPRWRPGPGRRDQRQRAAWAYSQFDGGVSAQRAHQVQQVILDRWVDVDLPAELVGSLNVRG